MDRIIEWYSNSAWANFFVWFPFATNLCYYPYYIWKRTRRDVATIRAKDHLYNPITVGHLFKYAGLVLVPGLNLIAFVFYVLPDLWKDIATRFAWLFNRRLADWKEMSDNAYRKNKAEQMDGGK